jgi:hypothetical protein
MSHKVSLIKNAVPRIQTNMPKGKAQLAGKIAARDVSDCMSVGPPELEALHHKLA